MMSAAMIIAYVATNPIGFILDYILGGL